MKVKAATKIALLLAAATTTCKAPVTPVDTAISSHLNTYEIQGSTAEELRAQMNRLGPEGYDGYTRWQVDWRYDYARSRGKCAISNSKVTTDINITLPHWDGANAPAQLQQRWKQFRTALERHEEQHALHGRMAAGAIAKMLEDAPSFANCEALEGYVDREGKRIIQKHNRLDAEYDRTTQHGRTEGVVFP